MENFDFLKDLETARINLSMRNEEKLDASESVEEKLLPFEEMKYIDWNADEVEDAEGFRLVSRSKKKGKGKLWWRKKVLVVHNGKLWWGKKCQLLILSTF
jgi:hypothetical protein